MAQNLANACRLGRLHMVVEVPLTDVAPGQHQVDGKAGRLELDAIVSYIFVARPLEVLSDGQIRSDGLDAYVGERVREAEAWAERAAKTPQHVASTGSPPEPAAMDRATAVGELRIKGSTTESWSNFGSARASRAVRAGRCQFEVHLHTAGVQQLGFATAAAAFSSEDGVGDCPDSYAFDGARVRRWSVTCAPPAARLSAVAP